MDDATRLLLGLSTMESLKERFLAEVQNRGADGVSPREMAKRHPDTGLLDWMMAGAQLNGNGKVAHTWSPVKNDPGTAQESRYTISVAPCR